MATHLIVDGQSAAMVTRGDVDSFLAAVASKDQGIDMTIVEGPHFVEMEFN